MIAFFSRLFRSLPLKTWFLVGGLALFLWLWIFGNHGLVDLERLLRLKRNYDLQKMALVTEKENLEQELKNCDNPQYMKHLIHQELGYIEPGEIVVQFTDKKLK